VLIKPINPFQFGQQQIFTPVSLINNGSKNYDASLHVTLLDYRGEIVGDYKSVGFKVSPGSMDCAMASPMLLSSSYSNSKFRDYERANASFPTGNYTYCVELLIQGAAPEKECSAFEMQALNPAQLIYPQNHEEIENFGSYQFSWMPCTPPRAQVFYVFKVVEIYDGQSATEAISRNAALHKIGSLGTSVYNYPVNAPQFEIGKHYAWQVECYEDLSKPEFSRDINAAVSSVVYDFYLKADDITDSLLFAKPKRKLDAGFSRLKDGKLYFTFSSDYLQGNLDYSFKDNDLKDIPVKIKRIDEDGSLSESPVVFIGENKYMLELTGKRPAEGLYTLVLKDQKGISYYLKIFIPTE